MVDISDLERWRKDPASFIEECLFNPETGEPFELFDAEREFLKHSFQLDASGRLLYPEQVYSGPKKTGKTLFASLITLTAVLLFGGQYAEAFCFANDQEQAQSRVFQAIKRIVEVSPLLRKGPRIIADKITFPAFGNAVIYAAASDYASAAGANPTISIFDELWAFSTERAYRLWDEMIPPPTRKVAMRLTVTYAGFSGESALLDTLYKRGLAQPLIGRDLHAGDGILMFWTHDPVAPWQTEAWLAEMRRSLRPSQYLRMIENRFVNSESSFIDLSEWDRCVDPNLRQMVTDRGLKIWVGCDASVKHDSTALAAVTWSQKYQRVQLVSHQIFQPSANNPIDFEADVEQTILSWRSCFNLMKVLYDPYQMHASAQRLVREGVPMEEFPQSIPRLTEASQNLLSLIHNGNFLTYPSEPIRLAINQCVALEGSRGWHITKLKQAHRIDIVVALAMAAFGAVPRELDPVEYYAHYLPLAVR